jgi:hypothetical protein
VNCVLGGTYFVVDIINREVTKARDILIPAGTVKSLVSGTSLLASLNLVGDHLLWDVRRGSPVRFPGPGQDTSKTRSTTTGR